MISFARLTLPPLLLCFVLSQSFAQISINTDGANSDSSVYKLTVNGQPAANGYTQFTNYSDCRLKHRIQDKIYHL